MNKRKVLFLTFLTIEEGNGISNKIKSQVQAFKDNGCDVSLMYYKIIDGCHYFFLDDKEFYKLGKFSRHFKKKLFRSIAKYIIENRIDILYYRYNNAATGDVIRFLRQLNGSCLRLLEIPTYPYDSEFENGPLFLRIVNCIDKYYRNKFVTCVDKIITFVDEKTIFGVPTIKISNGVDIKQIPLIKREKESGIINLIAVANIDFWHGLDRLIEGLGLYYSSKENAKKRIVNLKIIGDGKAVIKNELIALVNKLGLENNVSFYGNTSGNALNALFDDSDFAIGCLACHRKNITKVKALKNVEYAVRGIPFMYSEINDDFDNQRYVLKINPDDTPISIYELMSFYDKIVMTPAQIRETAIDLTWTSQMNKILREI